VHNDNTYFIIRNGKEGSKFFSIYGDDGKDIYLDVYFQKRGDKYIHIHQFKYDIESEQFSDETRFTTLTEQKELGEKIPEGRFQTMYNGMEFSYTDKNYKVIKAENGSTTGTATEIDDDGKEIDDQTIYNFETNDKWEITKFEKQKSGGKRRRSRKSRTSKHKRTKRAKKSKKRNTRRK